jgi:hypothetical protein
MIDAQTQQADNLRPLRAFVGALQGYLGTDQTYANQDNVAVNPPLQYQVIGPNGQVGQEGRPVSNAQPLAMLGSPVVLLIGVAIVAVLVLRK